MISLEKFVEKQKEEIQKLCSDHYEEFLQSVSRLKTVREEAQILREKILTLNEDIQNAGLQALSKVNFFL